MIDAWFCIKKIDNATARIIAKYFARSALSICNARPIMTAPPSPSSACAIPPHPR
jgi:hypothetical protein